MDTVLPKRGQVRRDIELDGRFPFSHSFNRSLEMIISRILGLVKPFVPQFQAEPLDPRQTEQLKVALGLRGVVVFQD
jgi:hypothetical protein